LAASSDQ